MVITTLERKVNVNNKTNLFTEKGIERCRFDMMIKWPSNVIRVTSNPFTERGDRFEKQDVRKMLRYLISYFHNKHRKEKWVMVELYDNSITIDDPERLVMRYKDGVLEFNRLKNYIGMFEEINFRLPVFLS